MTASNQPWEIEKKIPISFMLLLIGQFVVALWYTAKIDSRVGVLEKITNENVQIVERIVRVEVQIQGLRESQERMEKMLIRALDIKI